MVLVILVGRRRRDVDSADDLAKFDAAVEGIGGDCLKRAFCQIVFDERNVDMA